MTGGTSRNAGTGWDRKRNPIGKDPLDALMPPPGAEGTVPSNEEPQRPSRQQMSARVDAEVLDKVRDAITWLPRVGLQLTLGEFLDEAAMRYLESLQAEYNGGEPIPKRPRTLKHLRPGPKVS